MVTPGSFRPAALRALVIGMVMLLVVSVAALLMTRGGGDDVEGAAAPPSPSASPNRSDPATDPAFKRFYSQKLKWKGCDDGFSCATAVVPLDWDEPAGKTIELAMIRVPAGGTKIGSLLRNPGGPGASGWSTYATRSTWTTPRFVATTTWSPGTPAARGHRRP